jgi:hypothetical protein
MLFEPSRKTYYRFPSAQSISELDLRRYFPEKPPHAREEGRYASQSARHIPEDRESFTDI